MPEFLHRKPGVIRGGGTANLPGLDTCVKGCSFGPSGFLFDVDFGADPTLVWGVWWRTKD